MKPIIKALDIEEQLSYEVIYEPYALDAQEQWARPETIRKACENFNTNLAAGIVKANLFHSKGEDGNYTSTEAFTIVKSWINEVDSVIGDQLVPEGTWIAKLKWNDQDAWDKRKSGVLKGVSLGAKGVILQPTSKD